MNSEKQKWNKHFYLFYFIIMFFLMLLKKVDCVLAPYMLYPTRFFPLNKSLTWMKGILGILYDLIGLFVFLYAFDSTTTFPFSYPY
jgi:hypothetical protein